MHADLIVKNIGQLPTCASNGRPKRGRSMRDVALVEDAAVAISDGRFVAVGASSHVTAEWTAAEVIDAEGKAAFPGFVDPHTHIVFAGDRLDEFELKIQGADYLEILERGGGIISTVRRTREASFEQLVGQSRERLDMMLECGTTTAEVKTGYGLDTETELKMLRVIEELDRTHPIDLIPTFLGAHAVPPEFKGNTDGYVELVCREMMPLAWDWYRSSHFAAANIPFFADVFCEKNAFDLEQSRRVLETAASLGFRLKSHVDEFTNLGGSRLSVGLGAISIDHLDAISDEETAELAGSDTMGIVTPTVNFNFGSPHFADARRLIDSGCAVALSTDFNPGSAPCPSQPLAMAIACRYQKVLPSEATIASTINAAHACGVGAMKGSVEPGKTADLILLNFWDWRQTAHTFGASPVSKVIKNGRTVLG